MMQVLDPTVDFLYEQRDELRLLLDTLQPSAQVERRMAVAETLEAIELQLREAIGPNEAIYQAFGRDAFVFLSAYLPINALTEVIYMPEEFDYVQPTVELDPLAPVYKLHWYNFRIEHADGVTYPLAYVPDLNSLYTYLP